jgi:hypothetical protein
VLKSYVGILEMHRFSVDTDYRDRGSNWLFQFLLENMQLLFQVFHPPVNVNPTIEMSN